MTKNNIKVSIQNKPDLINELREKVKDYFEKILTPIVQAGLGHETEETIQICLSTSVGK